MSSTIDQRIVQMQFDNQKFESGVSQTLGTLDKLKDGLNFTGVQNSLVNIQNESNKFSLSGVINAVETGVQGFSTLEIIAVGALMRIGSQAVDLGEKLVKNLTIDQITSGWSKYESKVGSVQTIMNATGLSIDDVNEQLEKLIWFTDETSYSYSDMINNIGKFTNSGVDLGTAVTSMIGIATSAGLAGANVQDATHAMEGFAKSIAQGYVSRQNWQWIKTAHMDTTQFKQTMIDAAVAAGTLKKSGDGVYKTLKGTTVTLGDFETGLKDAWLNADVLNTSLAAFGGTTEELYKFMQDNPEIEYTSEAIEKLGVDVDDLGLKAFRASQEAKTFKDALEATKDAVSTGWMTTFEYIFGNYEEAKSFWTDVSNSMWDIFAASGETRNEILEIFHDLGGTSALQSSILNGLELIVNLLDPIKEGFFNVFIKDTEEFANILNNSISKISDFIDNFNELFRFSDDDWFENNLKSISDWESEISKIKDNKYYDEGRIIFLENLISKTKTFISDAEKVNERIDRIQRTFEGLASGIDIVRKVLSTIGQIIGKVITAFAPLADIILDATSAFGDWLVVMDEWITESGYLQDFVDDITPAIEWLATIAADGLQFVVDKFKAFLKYISPVKDESGEFVDLGEKKFKPFTTILEFFAKALDKVRTALEYIKPIFEKFGELVKNTVGIAIEKVKELGEKFKNNIIFGTGNVTGILNTSIFASAIASIIPLFTQFSKVLANSGNITEFFKNLSSALSESGGNIGKFLSGGWIKSFGDIKTKVTTTLDSVRDSLSSWKTKVDIDSIKTIAEALAILAASLVLISLIDSDKLMMAVGALGALMAELTIMIKSMSTMEISKTSNNGGLLGAIQQKLGLSGKSNNITKMATTMVIIAGAVLLLSSAVKSLGKMDTSDLVKGLAAVGVLMAAMYAFATYLSTYNGQLVKGLTGMIAVAAAIDLLVIAVYALGKMKTEVLMQGLSAVAALLGEFLIFTTLSQFSGGIISTAGALLIMANALLILTPSLMLLGTMKIDNIGRSLLVLGGALAEIAIFANTVKGVNAMEVAAALLVMSTAILVLVPALKILGGMSLTEIGSALLVLAGAFTVIGIAGALLGPIAPQIAALAGALTLLGIAVLAAGAGVLAFSLGFQTFVSVLSTGPAIIVAGLTTLIQALLAMIPSIAVTIGQLLIAVVKVIADGASTIIDAVVEILESVLDGLIKLIPKVEETIEALLDAADKVINEYFPRILDLGIDLIVNFLTGITKQMPRIVNAGVDTVIAFVNAVGSRMQDIVNSAFNLIITFINSLAEAIRTNGPLLIEAVKNLISAIFETLFGFLKDFINWGKDVVTNIKDGMLDGTVLGKLVSGATTVFGKIKGAFEGAWDWFKGIGESIASGLSAGINSGSGSAISAASSMAGRVTGAAKRTLQVYSPSRIFKYIGKMVDAGFVKGIDDDSDSVEKSAVLMSNNAIKIVKKSLSRIGQEEVGLNPVITPVVTMGAINDGSLQMAGKINTMTTDISGEISSKWESNSKIDEVINSVYDLSNKFSTLSNAVGKMQIVLDTGTLVGETAPMMDNALGQLMMYRGRGSSR